LIGDRMRVECLE